MVDVCVIGAGPVGVASALRLAELGLKVKLVESGHDDVLPDVQSLSDAEIVTRESHASMDMAVCRNFGGTSRWWGGRCVPLDPLDFEHRPEVAHSGWPIESDELAPFYPRACEFLRVGESTFSTETLARGRGPRPPLAEFLPDKTDVFASTDLERWSLAPNLGDATAKLKLKRAGVDVVLGTTCVGFEQPSVDHTVVSALCRSSSGDGEVMRLAAGAFVLAGGGIETARLVLNSMSDDGLKLTGSRSVGKFYMGHPSGKIASIVLRGDARKTIFGFEKDGRVYVRRRITLRPEVLREHGLLNIAFWFDNPGLRDPVHGSGVLSAAYLALLSPLGSMLAPAAVRARVAGTHIENMRGHLENCFHHPLSTVAEAFTFLRARFLSRPRIPGFHVLSGSNVYALHYHAEQTPEVANLVELGADRDRLGMRRARVTLKWSEKDIESVLEAHRLLDAGLRNCNAGELKYIYPETVLRDQIRAQGFDGYHQIGTLRMGSSPATSATDGQGRLWGTSNCFIAGSATFPTSGQANPTLAAVALALRQAEHIAATLKGLR